VVGRRLLVAAPMLRLRVVRPLEKIESADEI